MKKIAIDMDDVICDGGFMHLINDFLHSNYTVNDVKGYYMQELIPEEKQNDWRNYFINHNLYDYTEFIGDAYNVIKKLNEKYEIYIVTAYISKDMPETSAKMLYNKFNWLHENLPFINPEQYIFVSNKEIINCDIRIDDKLSNLKGNAQIKLLFDSYHNKEFKEEELEKQGIKRVKNWNEIEEILLKNI